MSGWMKQLEDWIKVDWVFKEMSKWKKWMDYEWINEWMNKWMNEQILERWQNWMLYSWRKAHLFILDLIKQSESGNKKCKNRSFLVILTPRCVAICAVTWSFTFMATSSVMVPFAQRQNYVNIFWRAPLYIW